MNKSTAFLAFAIATGVFGEVHAQSAYAPNMSNATAISVTNALLNTGATAGAIASAAAAGLVGASEARISSTLAAITRTVLNSAALPDKSGSISALAGMFRGSNAALGIIVSAAISSGVSPTTAIDAATVGVGGGTGYLNDTTVVARIISATATTSPGDLGAVRNKVSPAAREQAQAAFAANLVQTARNLGTSLPALAVVANLAAAQGVSSDIIQSSFRQAGFYPNLVVNGSPNNGGGSLSISPN